jgi:hypothetical protein
MRAAQATEATSALDLGGLQWELAVPPLHLGATVKSSHWDRKVVWIVLVWFSPVRITISASGVISHFMNKSGGAFS